MGLICLVYQRQKVCKRMRKRKSRTKDRIAWPSLRVPRFGRGWLLGLCAVLLASLGWHLYHDQFAHLRANTVSHLHTLKALAKGQQESVSRKTMVKKGSDPKEQHPPPIHFEFYQSLPNMQMNAQTNETMHAVTDQPKVVPAILAHPKKYALHIASFHDRAGAMRYRHALNEIGLQVAMVKVHEHDRVRYHIEQGPFTTLADAKLAQKQLQKRGIDSTVQE